MIAVLINSMSGGTVQVLHGCDEDCPRPSGERQVMVRILYRLHGKVFSCLDMTTYTFRRASLPACTQTQHDVCAQHSSAALVPHPHTTDSRNAAQEHGSGGGQRLSFADPQPPTHTEVPGAELALAACTSAGQSAEVGIPASHGRWPCRSVRDMRKQRTCCGAFWSVCCRCFSTKSSQQGLCYSKHRCTAPRGVAPAHHCQGPQ